MLTTKKLIVPALIAAGVLVWIAGSRAIADAPKSDAQPQIKLPPGWTEEDMKACAAAATPGKMHELLAQGAGTWEGKSTMWMGPGSEPVTSDCSSTGAMVMDGRFLKVDYKGDMMGQPYSGVGTFGFDNVAQKFQCSWMDNCSTGIMTGTGELSPDEKSITWKYTTNCPITKQPVTVREIDTMTGPSTKTMELFSTDPKSGKEYKMMSVQFTKK